jgi:hypothetical protein
VPVLNTRVATLPIITTSTLCGARAARLLGLGSDGGLPPKTRLVLIFETGQTCRPTTRTIRWRERFMHAESEVMRAKIAAAHHARGEIPLMATAFCPAALLGTR